MSTNWLERARQEIRKTPDQGAAETAKTPISAATAALQPGISEIIPDLDPSLPAANADRSTPAVLRRKRIDAIRKMIDSDSGETPHYFGDADTESYPDRVLVPGAKKIGENFYYFEQSFPREKWDEWRFLEMVASIQ